ncbi:MAG: hypothetical protein ABJK64_03695, partial [Paraglaciecola sp.]
MVSKYYKSLFVVSTLSVLALLGCGGASNTPAPSAKSKEVVTGIDLSMFTEGAFSTPPKIVDCETAQ